jgi:folate-binding protein YgfZ
VHRNKTFTGTQLAPLESQRLILASGADATSFLQGQLSSDLRKLTGESAQLSSYSTPKGRMLAVMTLLRLGDGIGIEVPASLADATLARLKKFVLRAKVKLELAPSGRGLYGPEASSWLHAHQLPTPESPLACITGGDVLVMRRPGASPRYWLHGAIPAAAAGTDADWHREELLAAVPTIHPQTVEHFVPQMCNLDRLGAIGFDKGCYTGQEIVARLHFLGTLKRRMYGYVSDADPGGPGTDVFEAAGGQAVGEIVDSAPLEFGGYASNIVMQIDHHDSATLRAGSAGGIALALRDSSL